MKGEVKVYLSEKLLEDINEMYIEKKVRNKAINTIGYFIYKYISFRTPLPIYHTFSNTFKRSIVGSNNYYKLWTDFLEQVVIQKPSGRGFSKPHKIAMKLRLNPKYYKGPYKLVKVKVPLSFRKKIVENAPASQYVLENLKKLGVNTESKDDVTSKIWEKFKENKFKETEDSFSIYHNNKWYNYSNELFSKQDFIEYSKLNYTLLVDYIEEVILSKRFRCQLSKTNNRIDHDLTNLDKLILPYLNLDGEPIIQIDLRNSQPLLLANILHNSINEDKIGIGKCKYLEEYLNGRQASLLFSDLRNEIDSFYSESAKGSIYGFFKNKVLTEQGQKCIERDRIKTSILAAIYAHVNLNSTPNNMSEDFKLFYKYSPKIGEELIGFKKYMINKITTQRNKIPSHYLYSKNKGNKRNREAGSDFLSVFLQRYESHIFIENILPLLEFSDLTCIPIHDSILCKKSEFNIVNNIIIDELDRCLGKGKYRLRYDDFSDKVL